MRAAVLDGPNAIALPEQGDAVAVDLDRQRAVGRDLVEGAELAPVGAQSSPFRRFFSSSSALSGSMSSVISGGFFCVVDWLR